VQARKPLSASKQNIEDRIKDAPASHWFLYIIETEGGRLYTGITTDIERRFSQHQSGKGAKYFHIDAPKQVVYRREFENRSVASKEEVRIKRLSRGQKLLLIKNGSN